MSLNLPQWMSLIIPALLLALFIVGVVRSGGVPRILLAVAAVTNGIGVLLGLFGHQISQSIGFAWYGMIVGVPNIVSGICTAVALIIGRPGVPTQPTNPGGYPPASGYPGYPSVTGYPPAAGHQGGAPYQQ